MVSGVFALTDIDCFHLKGEPGVVAGAGVVIDSCNGCQLAGSAAACHLAGNPINHPDYCS